MTQYPTDLTEKQWQVYKKDLELQERKRKHPLKEIIFPHMWKPLNGYRIKFRPCRVTTIGN